MTPHLTAGGGMAIEDAVILAEVLSHDALARSTGRMTERRFERVRTACDISLAICGSSSRRRSRTLAK